MTGVLDSWQRQINYLRVSVTDHCNLNCVYCSSGGVQLLPRSEVLTYEEIERVVQAAASLGISRVRLTGGEPLMRPEISTLVRMIAQVKGIDDLMMTTNGILLSKLAFELKEAGLKRVNVSLDTLKTDRFKSITGGDHFQKVIDGIETANRVGLQPVKINIVVMRGVNDDEVIDFARKSITDEWHVRFIEFMPFEANKAEALVTVSSQEIRDRIQSLGKLEPFTGETGSGPAKYYRFVGAKGTVGFISAVTEHFCPTCNRLRLTADGHLRPCLLDDDEIDLKEPLRKGATTDELKQLIQQAVGMKRQRHRLNEGLVPSKRSMRQIGG